VDYIILDSWVRWWGGDYKEQADRLVQAVRRHGRLVKIIAAGEPTQVEIYCMTPGYSNIFNGELDHWITADNINAPLGWNVFTQAEAEDKAEIAPGTVQGIDCAWLSINEDGNPNPNLTLSMRL